MIQTHGKKNLSMKFKSMIKAHDSISWKIIYQKAQFSLATSNCPILTSNIKKAQFSLATSKTQFLLAISKSPVFIGNIKCLIYVGTILSKTQDY